MARTRFWKISTREAIQNGKMKSTRPELSYSLESTYRLYLCCLTIISVDLHSELNHSLGYTAQTLTLFVG
jgi:hypothetical protein